jgi:hypothetical protein
MFASINPVMALSTCQGKQHHFVYHALLLYSLRAEKVTRLRRCAFNLIDTYACFGVVLAALVGNRMAGQMMSEGAFANQHVFVLEQSWAIVNMWPLPSLLHIFCVGPFSPRRKEKPALFFF